MAALAVAALSLELGDVRIGSRRWASGGAGVGASRGSTLSMEEGGRPEKPTHHGAGVGTDTTRVK